MNLRDAIDDAGLSRHANFLERLAKPSIRLIASRVAESETLPVGASRIGGVPDLPEGTTWACRSDGETRPGGWDARSDRSSPASSLPFLAQINFAEVAALNVPDSNLPLDGLLFVWVDTDTGACQLRYTTVEGIRLRPATFPDDLPEENQYPAHRLVPQTEITLPYYGVHGTIGGGIGDRYNMPSFFDSLDPGSVPGMLTDEEAGRYKQLRSNIAIPAIRRGMPESDSHRLLGHADIIQNPMILDCEVNGSDFPYDFTTLCDVKDPLTQRLIARARDSEWTLLLQIDSVSGADGMMWGDGGTHYWWIKRADLLRRDFSAVRYDLQTG